MNKCLIIKGLDCASCASNLESKIKKIKGVKDASLNFMFGKLNIEISEKSVIEEVIKVIKKIEPDCEVIYEK